MLFCLYSVMQAIYNIIFRYNIIHLIVLFFLSGDIGGSMGLFIGASMLTVIEIIDLFLTQAPLFALGCRRKQKQETLK